MGGGFRMGNTCKSMADSCQCLAQVEECSVHPISSRDDNDSQTIWGARVFHPVALLKMMFL